MEIRSNPQSQKRCLFIVLWQLAFVFIILLPVGFWLNRTFRTKTRLADLTEPISYAMLTVIMVAVIGLLLGLLGLLSGTRKIRK